MRILYLWSDLVAERLYFPREHIIIYSANASVMECMYKHKWAIRITCLMLKDRESNDIIGLSLLITIFHLLKHSFGLSAVGKEGESPITHQALHTFKGSQPLEQGDNSRT